MSDNFKFQHDVDNLDESRNLHSSFMIERIVSDQSGIQITKRGNVGFTIEPVASATSVEDGAEGEGVKVETLQEVQTFTMDNAYNYTGGFGRMQILMLICFIAIRNFGNYQNYGFALMIFPQQYKCWGGTFGPEKQLCPAADICKHLSGEAKLEDGLQFEVDTENEYYINNW